MKPSGTILTQIDIKGCHVENTSLWGRNRCKQAHNSNAKVFVVALLMLMLSSPTFATAVVVFRTPEEIIVAADSLTGPVRRDSPDKNVNTTCKIIRVGNMFFASSGATDDPKTGFDVRQIARESSGLNGLDTLRRFENAFIPALRKQLEVVRFESEADYRSLVEKGPSAIIFFGFESRSTFFYARGYQSNASFLGDISVRTIAALDCPGTTCPILKGTRIATVNLGSADATLRYLVPPFPPEAKLVDVASYLVELEIADKPLEVGRPIDVLRVTQNGGCWIKHEKECGGDIPFCALQPPKPKSLKQRKRSRPR